MVSTEQYKACCKAARRFSYGECNLEEMVDGILDILGLEKAEDEPMTGAPEVKPEKPVISAKAIQKTQDALRECNIHIAINTLEEIAEIWGIEIGPEPVLPKVWSCRYDRCIERWVVRDEDPNLDCTNNVIFTTPKESVARFAATAPKMAWAMALILDLGILGDVPKQMLERILRRAGVGI